MKKLNVSLILFAICLILSSGAVAQTSNSKKMEQTTKGFIRKVKDQQIVTVEEAQKGIGILTMKKILNNTDELDNKGRAFNHCFLERGSGLGYHKHEGTTETLYILKGKAEYTDQNGQKTILEPGDVTFTDNGDSHSIYCISDDPLEFIALVLFKE